MNKILIEILDEWMMSGLLDVATEEELVGMPAQLVPTANPEFGDFQCNAAMALAKKAGRNPRELAAEVIEALQSHELVMETSIAGPGFINVRVSAESLAEYVHDWLGNSAGNLLPSPGAGQTVILDYSSPNVAKPMHVGHIRSTVIGNAIYRIYRALGYDVKSDNHLGDWGTQFGLLMMGYRNFLNEQALEESPVEELERLYVESSKRSQEDEAWLEQAREELVKLQNGDEENTQLWQTFVDVSLKEFQKIYDRLDVSFDMARGESYYQPRLASTVDDLVNRDIATASEGALIVDMKEEGHDLCIVRKKDGGFNYTTTDVATIVQRVEEFTPSRIVYITDERQQLHFRQVFAISKKLGVNTQLDHVWFGLMRLPEGTIKTRDGQSKQFRLESLLDEAEKRAYDLVNDVNADMPEDQKRAVARAVGIGSVKYMDLSQNPQSIVNFSWDKAITLNGNSGPYIQYAYARTQSIFRKYNEQHDDYRSGHHVPASKEKLEKSILLLLSHYPVVVQQAAEQYKPSVVADYLYRLATEFSSFFQSIHIMKSEPGLREQRLALVESVASVLSHGLSLLGIETPAQV